MFNFKRRDSCFKCYASRGESERGGEGSDEISNILTKSIKINQKILQNFLAKNTYNYKNNSFINKPTSSDNLKKYLSIFCICIMFSTLVI